MTHRDHDLVEGCVGDALDRAAEATPEAIGWVFDDRRISFADMRRGADRVARALLALGIGEGDVVAVWMPNREEFAFVQFACAKIGAIIAAVNTRAKKTELDHHLRHSGARVLIMLERFLKHDFTATLGAVTALPQTEGRVQPGEGIALHTVISLETTPDPRFLSWEAFEARADATPMSRLAQVQAQQIPTRPMLMQYTSGTTARPKGALIAHRYVLNAGPALLTRLGVKRGESFLNTQPFYHIGGSCAALSAPLSLGCVIVSAAFYQAGEILKLIERERCVARAGYGAMYVMEMNHELFGKVDISSLRAGWCVAQPSLMERVRDRMDIPGLLQIYAATELGATSGWHDDPWEERARGCGRPLAGTEIRITDPDTGAPCPPGTIGEVEMRGWWAMEGYLNQPDATAATIRPDGWIRSGDLGHVDDSGLLYFSSRLKDMLKIGGENVAAEEVETVLLGHDDIVQAAVIGTPDPRLEEVVLAVVELRAGATLDAETLIAWCKTRMANFRIPREVIFETDWPMTDSGKIQKRKLRDRYAPRPEQAPA